SASRNFWCDSGQHMIFSRSGSTSAILFRERLQRCHVNLFERHFSSFGEFAAGFELRRRLQNSPIELSNLDSDLAEAGVHLHKFAPQFPALGAASAYAESAGL